MHIVDLASDDAVKVNVEAGVVGGLSPDVVEGGGADHHFPPSLLVSGMSRPAHGAGVTFFTTFILCPLSYAGYVRVTHREELVAADVTLVHILGRKLPWLVYNSCFTGLRHVHIQLHCLRRRLHLQLLGHLHHLFFLQSSHGSTYVCRKC